MHAGLVAFEEHFDDANNIDRSTVSVEDYEAPPEAYYCATATFFFGIFGTCVLDSTPTPLRIFLRIVRHSNFTVKRLRGCTHTHTHTPFCLSSLSLSLLRRWVLDYIIHMLNHESEKEEKEIHQEHIRGAHNHGVGHEHAHSHTIPSVVVSGDAVDPDALTPPASTGSQGSNAVPTRETSLSDPLINSPTSPDGGEQGEKLGFPSSVPQGCQSHLGANPAHGSQDHLHVLDGDHRSGSYVSAIEVRTALTVDEENTTILDKRLLRMALVTGLAIALHNLPEGLATFIAAAQDPSTGAPIAIAIGIHNIPEGICVAAPIYHATGSKWRAFFWGTVSGLAETVAGAIG